jgi:uracil-DNA glycosylase
VTDKPADLDDAIAWLAQGLMGAIETSHIPSLPRPQFTAAATPEVAPQSTPSTPLRALDPVLVQAPSPALVPDSFQTTAEASPASAPAALTNASLPRADRLRVLQEEIIGACTRCKLHRSRNKIVFGAGNPQARVVFVGEGPGADEDRQGIPFVGRAGQLLTKMIEAMTLQRDDVYICNVVKCRPPNNRDPEADEVAACEGFMVEQLGIVRPQVIVGLGRHAVQTLLRVKTPISKLRGQWHQYQGIALMPTYHPSYLLRQEDDPEKKVKREAWSDLQQVMQRLGLRR